MKPDLGIFEPLFETAHGYLALLHLAANDAGESIAQVKACCASVPDPYPDICRLLVEPNWRPHLVAATAMFVCGCQREGVEGLWRTVDSGSWVTPQLCATLAAIDPDFENQARSRLESGCQVEASQLRSMSPMERHSAAGPAGLPARSAKTAQALMRLVQLVAPQAGWPTFLRGSTELQKLLNEDIDSSGDIAESWLARIRQLTSSAPPSDIH